MKVRIEVTQRHIDEWQGSWRDNAGRTCAIAKALRSVGRPYWVGRREIMDESTMTLYHNTEQIREWIIACDNREFVQPFTLILDDEKLTAEMEQSETGARITTPETREERVHEAHTLQASA